MRDARYSTAGARAVVAALALTAMGVATAGAAPTVPTLGYLTDLDSTRFDFTLHASVPGATDVDSLIIRAPESQRLEMEAFADGGVEGSARATLSGDTLFQPQRVSVDFLYSVLFAPEDRPSQDSLLSTRFSTFFRLDQPAVYELFVEGGISRFNSIRAVLALHDDPEHPVLFEQQFLQTDQPDAVVSVLRSGTLEPGLYGLGFDSGVSARPSGASEFPFHFSFEVTPIPLPPALWPALACLAACAAKTTLDRVRRQ